MSDTSPGGTPRTATPAASSQRVFYSAASANEFFDRLQVTLAEQHAQTQALVAQSNATIAALTTAVQAFLAAVPLPTSPTQQSAEPGTQSVRESPTPALAPTPAHIPALAPSELPVSPYHSAYRSPVPAPVPPASTFARPAPPIPPAPPLPPLTRETISFTHAETATSTLSGNTSGIKLPAFHGKDGENVVAWLHQAERFFKLKGTPDERKVDLISFHLDGDAQSFFHYCYVSNNYVELTWPNFQHAFRQKYEVPETRATLLRDKLKALRYRGPHDMPDYCERFRHYETQIYDMAFTDRLDYFLSRIPGEAAMHIRNQGSLRSKDMEIVYQLARQWATNARMTRHPEPHRRNKPLLKFGKKRPGGSPSASVTTAAKDSDDDDDLDIIVPDELNKMDLMATECWNCGKRGHFSRDCKSPRKDKKVKFSKGSPTSTSKHNNKRTLYKTVDESSSDDSQSDYGPLNPSSSEEEEALDVLTMMSTCGPDDPQDDNDSNQFHLMSTYEYNEQKTSVTASDGVRSTKLPVYDVIFNGEHSGRGVVDSCASTFYFKEAMAKTIGAKITKIRPKKVRIADKDVVMVDGYCTFEAKIGDLPRERITAYTFPLGSVDLILGLPWLQKHNPRMD